MLSSNPLFGAAATTAVRSALFRHNDCCFCPASSAQPSNPVLCCTPFSPLCRSPALAAAVVRSTLFSQFEDADAPQLAALAYMASAVGLRTGAAASGSTPGTTTTLPDDEEVKRLMGRLLLAAAPLLPAMARRDAALLGVAAARAGLRPGDEGAVAQLVGRVVALGLEADEPAVVTVLKAALQA